MPTDLKNLDPLHLGINSAILDLTHHNGYFDKTFCTGQYPTNDNSAGDGYSHTGYPLRYEL